MTPLERIQGDFQEHLLRDTAAVERHVFGTTRVPLATRLGIYSGAYRGRLADALKTNFPALAALLGEEDFDSLATDYVRTHDSPYFSIRYYGDALPAFLAAEARYAEVPLLAELARWEWTMTEVFDAADTASLTAAALTRVAPAQWAQLRFTFHPSVRRLALEWNAPQIWAALTKESERPAAASNETPVEWLLWREELTSYFRSLGAAEATLLDAARSGWPFGELCERLCGEVGEAEAPARAAALLRGWIDSGLITAAA